jgi:cell division initiation protein
LKGLVAEHRTREQTLQETLVTAQKMAEEFKERSKAQADQLMRETRVKAERALGESQDQLARLEAEISRCKLERDLFEKRLRSTIEEHLDLLDQRKGERSATPPNVHPIRRAGLDVG